MLDLSHGPSKLSYRSMFMYVGARLSELPEKKKIYAFWREVRRSDGYLSQALELPDKYCGLRSPVTNPSEHHLSIRNMSSCSRTLS